MKELKESRLWSSFLPPSINKDKTKQASLLANQFSNCSSAGLENRNEENLIEEEKK